MQIIVPNETSLTFLGDAVGNEVSPYIILQITKLLLRR
jgi:hypothetical protein